MITKIEKIRKNIKLPNIEGTYDSYKVPISELKYNPYNDRFAMETIEWQRKERKELAFNPESQEFLFNLLSSNKKRNNVTRDDILENGVLKDIVIDKNGVILDGNRRISILRTILANEKKFKLNKNQLEAFSAPTVVIIEKSLSEKEIRDYETSLQISEDEKVEYDPINIYLKINRLFESSFHTTESGKIKEVAKKMGARYTETDIKNRILTFRTMKYYLNFLKKDQEYTYLKKKEDHLKSISTFQKSFEKENAIKFEKNKKMSEEEYHNVLEILFLMTAAQVEGKQFRKFVPGSKQLGKTPLQSSRGIKIIHSKISNNFENYRTSPIFNSDEKIDLKAKKIFKDAEIRVNMQNSIFKIEQSFLKVNKRSEEILDWSKRLIGNHKIHKKHIKILEETVDNIEKTIEKMREVSNDPNI